MGAYDRAFNEVVVKCVNPQCPKYDVERVASLPMVGNGLFMTGGIMCECGFPGETIRIAGLGD